MNVRFAAGEIRLRISTTELEQLLAGRKVRLGMALPRLRRFEAMLSVSPINWDLASDPTGLWVTVPRSDLETFAATLPTKDGLSHEFSLEAGEVLRLRLEVDVRKRR